MLRNCQPPLYSDQQRYMGSLRARPWGLVTARHHAVPARTFILTLVAAFTQDNRAVQTLAQHADIRTTHRYTGATVDPRALAAVLKVGKQLESIVDGQN